MRGFLTYLLLFIVAVVVTQLFVLDSIRVSIYFSPLAYIAFVALLPVGMRPVAVLLLGFATGVFIDFFEGTGGAHTAATVLTAYSRRWMMIATLGRETVDEETAMPSTRSLGSGRFMRYAALVSGFHSVVFFSLEALSLANYLSVLLKSVVSGVFTLLSVLAISLLFTVKAHNKRG